MEDGIDIIGSQSNKIIAKQSRTKKNQTKYNVTQYPLGWIGQRKIFLKQF